MRVVDRRRHQLGRLVAGVAEHQALVAGTGVEMVVAGLVDALGDVVGLLVVADHDGTALVVDAVVGVVVADALDGVARDLDVVDVRVGRDLAGQHHEAGVAQRLGGDARARILREDRVQDGVGDLVRDLVGMAFRDGLGGEEEIGIHAMLLDARWGRRHVARGARSQDTCETSDALATSGGRSVFAGARAAPQVVIKRAGRRGEES